MHNRSNMIPRALKKVLEDGDFSRKTAQYLQLLHVELALFSEWVIRTRTISSANRGRVSRDYNGASLLRISVAPVHRQRLSECER